MDFQTIIIIVVIVLLVAYVVNRNRSNATSSTTAQGNERPTHNDPNIQGHGSFGRDHNAPAQASNQGYIAKIEAAQPDAAQADDPNIRGQGGFGRDKS